MTKERKDDGMTGGQKAAVITLAGGLAGLLLTCENSSYRMGNYVERVADKSCLALPDPPYRPTVATRA